MACDLALQNDAFSETFVEEDPTVCCWIFFFLHDQGSLVFLLPALGTLKKQNKKYLPPYQLFYGMLTYAHVVATKGAWCTRSSEGLSKYPKQAERTAQHAHGRQCTPRRRLSRGGGGGSSRSMVVSMKNRATEATLLASPWFQALYERSRACRNHIRDTSSKEIRVLAVHLIFLCIPPYLLAYTVGGVIHYCLLYICVCVAETKRTPRKLY